MIWTSERIKYAVHSGFNADLAAKRIRIVSEVFQGDGGIFFVSQGSPPFESPLYCIVKFDPIVGKLNTVFRSNVGSICVYGAEGRANPQKEREKC